MNKFLVIERNCVWLGGLAFFALVNFKLMNMDISRYEFYIGVTLTSIFLVLCVGLGYLLPFFYKNSPK